MSGKHPIGRRGKLERTLGGQVADTEKIDSKSVMSFIPAHIVSQLLGCSRALVYKLSISGKLPSYRFGSAFRFKREDVEAFINKSKRN